MSAEAAPAAEPLVALGRTDLARLDRSLSLEWLETNGLGGYASSTPLLCHRRRYHGLLVSPAPGSAKRYAFLSRFEEWLHVERGPGDELAVPLSVARYEGEFSPAGHVHLAGFELAPFPRFTYRVPGGTLQREVLMVRGSPTVLVRWAWEGEAPVRLRLRALLPFREADDLTFENSEVNEATRPVPRAKGGVRVRLYDSLPELALTWGVPRGAAPVSFTADPVWYRGIEYAMDLERGYDGHEDLYSPGLFEARLEPGGELVAAATLGRPVTTPRKAWSESSRARRSRALPPGSRGRLEAGADDFLYEDENGRPGVIAGFPWFLEWGRDTFIALPGLTLARDRIDDCARVLSHAAGFLADGLLPNIYGVDVASSHYGSVDAALWFARAVRLFAAAGGDPSLVRDELLATVERIAEGYSSGAGRAAELGIELDDAGLLRVGSEELNPTWMDARTPAGPVTPRAGGPVEIEALWYLLLAHLEEGLRAAGRKADAGHWADVRERAGAAFVERYWRPDRGVLADVWTERGADHSIRPNMVIAAALDRSPLTREMRAGIVRRAEAELVTPFGLRTLSPRDPAYLGSYQGGPVQRDSAYHQGTVWPWLAGFHVEACLAAFGDDARRRARLGEWIAGLEACTKSAGLGHVSEVFDGDPPHRPGGSFAQAWSTAEVLRARRLLESPRP